MSHPANPPITDKAAARSSASTLRFMLPYLRKYRWQLLGSLVAILFASGSILGMGSALRYLLDHGIMENNEQLLTQGYWILLGVIFLLAVASYVRVLLLASVGEKMVADIRRDVFSRLVGMHVGYFENERTGAMISRLLTDSTLLQAVLTTIVAVALRNVLLLTGGLTLMFVSSPSLTGMVLLIVPLVVLPIIVLGRKVRVMSRETQSRVAELNAHAQEMLSGIRTVQAMTMEDMARSQFGVQATEVTNQALHRVRSRAVLLALVIMLVFGAVVTTLWFGGHEVMRGTMSPGTLSAFVFYSVIVAGAVGAISEVMADIQRAAGAAERLSEMFALAPEITSPANPQPLPQAREHAVQFEQLSFTYPSRIDRQALKDISFTVKPGEVVALVGPSGAGKTTIFQMLLRFYDPDSGRVTLDGADIRQFNLHDYRSIIGLVPQDPVIFAGDVISNIRCGKPEASEAEVLEAARAAHAMEFIEKLPQGLATQLGERGVQLSGGQRQRIAIARALIRNPRLLLLDEATSALDSENELLIRKALESLMKGRTTLIIAHRLSTVMNASRILLMNDGKIEAMGTHAELLATSPLYARHAKLQFHESFGQVSA